MDRKPLGWAVRTGIFLLPFTTALVAFRAGVTVTERAVADADLLTQVYYAVGLFVLGGLDLGTPTGGSSLARGALWFSYFAAPLITTGAVVEGLLRAMRPPWMQTRGLHDHIVLVGLGRIGMLYLEALRSTDGHRSVLIVGLDPNHPNLAEARGRYGARFIQGDITHQATRDLARLQRARGVVLITSDDLVNLVAAWDVLDDCPSAKVVTHVSDLGMRRRLGQLQDRDHSRVAVFNAHRIAARRLWRGFLADRFERTAGRDVVVLAGFGRFGQTILEYLQDKAGEDLGAVIIVDLQATTRALQFAEQVPQTIPYTRVAIDGDVDDPGTWERVDAAVGELDASCAPPVFVLGVDGERTNLRAAARLKGRGAQAGVFVRTFHESRFADEMASEFEFEVLSVERLLREALVEAHSAWFGARRAGSRSRSVLAPGGQDPSGEDEGDEAHAHVDQGSGPVGQVLDGLVGDQLEGGVDPLVAEDENEPQDPALDGPLGEPLRPHGEVEPGHPVDDDQRADR